MTQETYEVKFISGTNKITMDQEVFRVRTGPRSSQLKIADLRYLYVLHHQKNQLNEPGSMVELMLSHHTGGKDKCLRMAAVLEPAFNAVVQSLLSKRPDIDIRDKPVKEAHKLMGTFDFAQPWVIALMIVVVLGAWTAFVQIFY